MEIKDTIAERCEKLGDLTQEKYEEVVKTVIAEYEAAKKVTAEEAKKLEAELRDGYETVRQTIHKHTA
jgi:DNA-binding ferritin-like protein